MAIIIFTPDAEERYRHCVKVTTPCIQDKNYQLETVINRLRNWSAPVIHIARDFDEMSFTFREEMKDGRTGICGGIIYHGPRDGFGSGAAPTFSVTMGKTTGYQIHT